MEKNGSVMVISVLHFITLTKASSLFTKAFCIKECEENILENLLQMPSRSPGATCSADVVDITGQRCNMLQRVKLSPEFEG